MASWSTETYRTSLENTISMLQAERNESIYEVVQCMMHSENETTDYTNDIATWLDKVQTVHSRFQLCEYYLSKGQNANAQNTLSAISTSFELSEKEQTELNAYTDFFNFKIGLQNSSISIHELDEVKKTDLTNIAEMFPSTYGGQRAQNALCFFYNDCITKSFAIVPPQNKKVVESVNNISVQQEIKVYPNPAKDHVTFQIMNPDKSCEGCKIVITDLHGRTVNEGELNELSGMYIWDTRKIVPGAYIYQVKTNLSVESGKVVIMK